MQGTIDYFLTLDQSDVCLAWPGIWAYLKIQAGHVLVGVCAGIFLPVVMPVLWIVKELLGDIPNCGFSTHVMLDTSLDLAFGALGFWFAFRFLKQRVPAKLTGLDLLVMSKVRYRFRKKLGGE